MLQLNPQYLLKNGKEEFVILPIDEFIKIQDFLKEFYSKMKEEPNKQSKKRVAGSAKHLIIIPDSFYESLDCFQEYST